MENTYRESINTTALPHARTFDGRSAYGGSATIPVQPRVLTICSSEGGGESSTGDSMRNGYRGNATIPALSRVRAYNGRGTDTGSSRGTALLCTSTPGDRDAQSGHRGGFDGVFGCGDFEACIDAGAAFGVAGADGSLGVRCRRAWRVRLLTGQGNRRSREGSSRGCRRVCGRSDAQAGWRGATLDDSPGAVGGVGDRTPFSQRRRRCSPR